jgi:Asp-tRNA(Asn)/Glu-tRNA(Gln) amidotransferase A subunit family amidase
MLGLPGIFSHLIIRAVIEVNPDALEIAEGLDQERKNGKIRSPLHGIPFLVKDVGLSRHSCI